MRSLEFIFVMENNTSPFVDIRKIRLINYMYQRLFRKTKFTVYCTGFLNN